MITSVCGFRLFAVFEQVDAEELATPTINLQLLEEACSSEDITTVMVIIEDDIVFDCECFLAWLVVQQKALNARGRFLYIVMPPDILRQKIYTTNLDKVLGVLPYEEDYNAEVERQLEAELEAER